MKRILLTIMALTTLTASATELSKLSLNELNVLAKDSANQMVSMDSLEDGMERHMEVLEEIRKRSHSGLEESNKLSKVMGMNPWERGYIKALDELNDQ